MKEKESAPKISHSELLIKSKECLAKFEELRGYL
jgi:hypothetical protein